MVGVVPELAGLSCGFAEPVVEFGLDDAPHDLDRGEAVGGCGSRDLPTSMAVTGLGNISATHRQKSHLRGWSLAAPGLRRWPSEQPDRAA